jgi:hypothetical protein
MIMWRFNFMEIMRFFPNGLNHSKIQVWFKIEFNSENCKPKSREILELDQKGKLCHLDLSISMRSLENFGQKEGCVLHFQTWSFETYLENLRIKRNKIAEPAQLNSPAQRSANSDREAHPAVSLHRAARAPCSDWVPVSTDVKADHWHCSDCAATIPTLVPYLSPQVMEKIFSLSSISPSRVSLAAPQSPHCRGRSHRSATPGAAAASTAVVWSPSGRRSLLWPSSEQRCQAPMRHPPEPPCASSSPADSSWPPVGAPCWWELHRWAALLWPCNRPPVTHSTPDLLWVMRAKCLPMPASSGRCPARRGNSERHTFALPSPYRRRALPPPHLRPTGVEHSRRPRAATDSQPRWASSSPLAQNQCATVLGSTPTTFRPHRAAGSPESCRCRCPADLHHRRQAIPYFDDGLLAQREFWAWPNLARGEQ